MKNYKTIEKEIHAKAEEINTLEKAIETKADEISFKGMTFAEIKEYTKDEEKQAKRKEIDDQLIEMEKQRKISVIELEILKNNYVLSVVNTDLPKAVAIVNKYAGKSYGPVTADKIKEEVEKETAFRLFSIERGDTRGDSFRFWLSVIGKPFNAGGSYKKELSLRDDDNKITVCDSLENVKVYFIKNTYIDSPRKAAVKMLKLKEKAEKQLKELKDTVDQYNQLCRGDIKTLYADLKEYR